MNILIKDETFSGKVLQEITLHFSAQTVTIKEIITARVLKEVDDYNQKLPSHFIGLIEPTDAERTLNGYKLKPKQVIDGEKQVYIALDAFQKNGFFVLVDQIQSESLAQEVALKADTVVSFIKLTPLVGG